MGLLTRKCSNCGTRVIKWFVDFCPRCEHRFKAVAQKRWQRGDVRGDSWLKDADPEQHQEIAIRLSDEDIDGFLPPIRRPITIEQGTRGLLFQGGKLTAELPPGYYDQDGWAKRLANLNLSAPTSIVIISDAEEEIEFDLATDEKPLYTAENVKLEEVKCRLSFRVDQPEVFFVQAMHGKSRYTAEDLRSFAEKELLNVVQTALRSEKVVDLYGNMDVRMKVEQAISNYMKPALGRYGLGLVQLRFFEFLSNSLDTVRNKYPKLFELAEEEKIEAKADEIERDRLARLSLQEIFRGKTDQEKAAALNELKEKDLLSDQHLYQLARSVREEDEDYKIARAFFKDHTELTQRFQLEELQKDFAREQAHKDVEHKAKLEDIERESDLKDASQSLELLEKSKTVSRRDDEELLRIDREDELARKKAYAELIAEMAAISTEALISFADADRAKLLAQLNMSEEQMLVLQAGDKQGSLETVSSALAEKYKSMNMEKMEEIYKSLLKEKSGFLDRQQAFSFKALETQRDAAGKGIVGGTVVAPPGVSVPGMVGGTMHVATSSDDAPEGVICSSCGATLRKNANFCGKCGKKVEQE